MQIVSHDTDGGVLLYPLGFFGSLAPKRRRGLRIPPERARAFGLLSWPYAALVTGAVLASGIPEDPTPASLLFLAAVLVGSIATHLWAEIVDLDDFSVREHDPSLSFAWAAMFGAMLLAPVVTAVG